MDLTNDKLSIIEWVVRQDKPAGLQKILSAIQQLENETIDEKRPMGYRRVGVRVSGKELVESIRASLEEIRQQQVISLNDLEEESEQW